jgi:glucose-1-phosphate cytidylyltransferase
MITIGEKPILWHIMKIYSFYGFNEFVICLGYKGECITDYFANYAFRNSNVTFDFTNYSNSGKVGIQLHSGETEPWKVTLVDTGLSTMTGGRVCRVRPFLENSTFMLTYGDGVGNININELLQFHRNHGKLATVTAVQPLARFGSLELATSGKVLRFMEKPLGGSGIINAGFFVLEPGVFDYIDGDIDSCVFEESPLERLAADGQLYAYQHNHFWKPMDTLRDRRQLEEEWAKKNCAWRIWP